MRNELQSYYGWELPCDSIDSFVEKYSLHKLTIVRSFCIKTGIQLLLRDYNFDHKTKPVFNEDEILNIFPVVKHINPKVSLLFINSI